MPLSDQSPIAWERHRSKAQKGSVRYCCLRQAPLSRSSRLISCPLLWLFQISRYLFEFSLSQIWGLLLSLLRRELGAFGFALHFIQTSTDTGKHQERLLQRQNYLKFECKVADGERDYFKLGDGTTRFLHFFVKDIGFRGVNYNCYLLHYW